MVLLADVEWWWSWVVVGGGWWLVLGGGGCWVGWVVENVGGW